MKSVKFRVFDINLEEYYYSDKDYENVFFYIDSNGIYVERLELTDRIIGGEHVQAEEFIKPQQILEQYTGLKDIKGKEIYVGDIVACKDNFLPMFVSFKEHGFWFDYLPILYASNYEWEIIGNIHHNRFF